MDGTSSVTKSSSLKSTLFIGGMADLVLTYDGAMGTGFGALLYAGTQVSGYTGSSPMKRIVGITDGGHLAPTSLCAPNSQGKLPLEVAVAHQVTPAEALVNLNDCGSNGFDWKVGVDITSDITTGVLEETLHCQDIASQIAAIKSRHPEVGDYRETLK
jgi:hypothetical protein